MQWLGARLGSAGTNSPRPSRSSQAREDASLVPAAQGLTSHKHSHTSCPLLSPRLVEVRVPRAPRPCPWSHGQPPAFADPYVPWLMLSPPWHALLSLRPGPTHSCVAQILPSLQVTVLFLLSHLSFPDPLRYGALSAWCYPGPSLSHSPAEGPNSLSLFPVPSLGVG